MIQICNHNYLLADAEHRRQGFHPLLKGYGILVVDEAHKLWDAACQMYGEALSSQDFEELTNLLEKEKCSQAVHTLREKSAHFAAAFRQVETREDERCRLPLILTSIRSKVLMDCENSFSQIKRTLPEKAPRWLVHRLEKMERTTRLFREQDSRYIRYLKYDRAGIPHLCAVSRDIPKRIRRALWEQRIPAILTSGTLKAGTAFSLLWRRRGWILCRMYEPILHHRLLIIKGIVCFISLRVARGNPTAAIQKANESPKKYSSLSMRPVGTHWCCLHPTHLWERYTAL